MSVTYVIGFEVREECRDEFLALLNDVLDAMRHEESFVNATLHQDPADPLRFLGVGGGHVDGEDLVAVGCHCARSRMET